MNDLKEIVLFILQALKKAWPYLAVSIPLSVAVNLSGAGEKVKGIIGKNPAISIVLATLFGALSPLCSCTVIPVIFGLLTAGVPLGPVMAFWIASPSMDPEIFFLSVTTLGWDLAIWRLASTFILSLAAGFTAHYLYKKGWFSDGILRQNPRLSQVGFLDLFKRKKPEVLSTATDCGCQGAAENAKAIEENSCCTTKPVEVETCCGSSSSKTDAPSCDSVDPSENGSCCNTSTQEEPLWKRIAKESWKSLIFVGKFLLIAYLLEALIVLYIPEIWIEKALGSGGASSIGLATLFGLPFYTTNLAALGILGGLLQKGMLPAAALAFLISGPTTTLPAMSAVFGIATPRVFRLYLAVSLMGAIGFGFIYLLLGGR